ncbi:MAG: Gfo/Idh/MocA family oxidoreductase [Planctomycetota bacterium]|nr:Gfo/Idh/MocA family oxidoreductase [Planctomycetota bacterium]
MTPRPDRPGRRAFVKTVALGVAAPFVVPSRVLGKDGAVAPSERITMGFIGIGGQGGGHLFGGAWTYVAGGYLGRDEVQVLGVCDVWRQKREGAKARVNQHYANKTAKDSYKSCEAYCDFRELIARPDIDAVLIGSPAHWHALRSNMDARALKDVYCEKPVALTIAEGRAMVNAVTRYGRVYQAGSQQRSCYGGKFRKACEYVRNGRLGQLKGAYAALGGGGFNPGPGPTGPGKPVPKELDWELFLGPAPWTPFTGNCGAHMFGWGSDNWGQHHYDICQWGINGDDTGPTDIVMEEGKPVYKYANGGVIYGCGCPGVKTGEGGPVTFLGTEGKIVVDRDQIYSDPKKILEQPLTASDVRLYKSDSHADNFLDCIRTRKRPISPAETAQRAISILLLGGIATKLQRALKWDPQKEKFINDAEADKMTSYAMREPWHI